MIVRDPAVLDLGAGAHLRLAGACCKRNGLVNDWLDALGSIDEPLQLVHNFAGAVIGMSHVMLPFLVLPLYASMRAIDRDYIRAASNLGASPSARVLAGVLPAVAARAGGGPC